MGIDLGKAFSNAAKEVSDFVDKQGRAITNAIDQNGDGKLDFADYKVITDRVQADRAKAQRKADLERLRPLFPKDFERADFVMPKLIRIDKIDKQHAENSVCKGSIGFKTVLHDTSVITVYRHHAEELGLTFYPVIENTVYYVDPCDSSRYISLNDYFSYMRMQRVFELQRIAQSLGAKHFRVTYKENKKTVSSKTIGVDVKGKAFPTKRVEAKANRTVRNSSLSTVNVEAEMTFPGRQPTEPELCYLKKEINIINLIRMRMDPLSPLQHQHISIAMSNSSGIRKKDAANIDAILKMMKISGDTTVISQAENEEHSILEYDIEF